MRLTKLELQGFKSFADRTHLAFEPGVTAIVGPNGCGKSNVSDAVRWVLGEQRARLLRGAKMEEVIFQGSSARRPVNVAEVSLHFENDDGAAPGRLRGENGGSHEVAFREVVITRRLSRSGESEYLLNGAPCRLRDIQDLLRGTGLGADAGVIIESKMIDALLSDRPDDRRELFEEAAGIALYRDRKRSTERRLEETALDLQRLDDLINEVQSQVRSLLRQRRRAERARELGERRFVVEITLASREMEAWHGELGRLTERVALLREEAPRAQDAVAAAERTRDGAYTQRAAAEGQRAELARLVGGQRHGVLQLQGEIAVAEERQRNAVARRRRAEEEQQQGEEHGVRIRGERMRAGEERVQLEAELSEAAEELRQRVALDEEARRVVAGARAALEQSERQARELSDTLRRLEIEREGASRDLGDVSGRVGVLEAELVTLDDAVAAVRRELGQAAEQLELSRAAAAAATVAATEARARAHEARQRDSAARVALARADEELGALQRKVSVLETLERERVGLAPAAARLLEERDSFGEGAVVGPLSDFITADVGAARTVERFLGATVHAVLVRDEAAAERIRRWHAETSPGPLLLLPVDAMPDDPAEFGEPEPDALVRLVEAAHPAGSWVRALLGFARAVDGGLGFVDARGAAFLPGSGAGKEQGPLQRRAELAALRVSLDASAERRAAAAAAAEAARAELAAAEHAAAAAAEAATAATQRARRADEHRAEVDRRRARAEREAVEARTTTERLVERRTGLAERVAQLDGEIGRLGAALTERDAAVAAARERAADAAHALEEAREGRTMWQVRQAQAQARLQVASDRERHLAEEMEHAAARLDALRAELSTLADADSALAEQMAGWRLDLETREATLADVESLLARAEDAVREADEALASADRGLDSARRQAGEYATELHQAELRYTELSGRRTAIRERLEGEWRRPLEELFATLQPTEVDEAALRAEAEEIRQALDTLGTVNPLAIEEHEEESKRLEFLTTQRADLAEAKQSLQQAIREIDATARELFLTTFAQVRENFRHIFMTLFGGGDCDLKLENPDAPLDCDIEVHASPRGKKTQRIHLLSSGERALVALSLLFGIFLTKPSPFCLLDEVDAPLDDQNVGRFVRMLTEFKKKTQFIVITHNPRTTTEAADAVYGVTMQEPGVSSLVSVRMRGAAVDDGGAAAPAAPVRPAEPRALAGTA
ncbi:MAG TPA: chromosome segregation protein SMC [Gemmatimonadaceae bacterium]|nr:chromosome segregation protein SMC [Gemmatimonadaceae bacterium]